MKEFIPTKRGGGNINAIPSFYIPYKGNLLLGSVANPVGK